MPSNIKFRSCVMLLECFLEKSLVNLLNGLNEDILAVNLKNSMMHMRGLLTYTRSLHNKLMFGSTLSLPILFDNYKDFGYFQGIKIRIIVITIKKIITIYI